MIKLVLSAVTVMGIIVIMILKRIWSKESQDKKRIEKTDMDDPSSITSTFNNLNRCIIIGLILLLAGCARVVLHPIEHNDIFQVKKGLTYQAPKDGYFLSDFYIREVMEAKVK